MNTPGLIRVSVNADRSPWSQAFQGINRRALEMVEGGLAAANAINVARFDPNAVFPFHTHGGGEEMFVLDGPGGLHDNMMEYKPGFYVRFPINSQHEPYATDNGCNILVKMSQMIDPNEPFVVVDTGIYQKQPQAIQHPDFIHFRTGTWEKREQGRFVMLLFKNDSTGETVTLEKWLPGFSTTTRENIGEEIFVLKGTFSERTQNGEETYTTHQWVTVGKEAKDMIERKTTAGTIFYRKTGHLEETYNNWKGMNQVQDLYCK
jgi:anti-sigma factor ChrR (cupin superfamily)